MPSRTLRKPTNPFNRMPVVNTLLLDDQTVDRMRIRRMAQRSKLPLNIVEATSLSAMSDAISKTTFDLFLLDYKLPVGDGLQAVDLIRNQPANRDAALIMITGNPAADVAVSAFRRGCTDLITKEDLSAELLRDRVNAALRPKKMVPSDDLFEVERVHRQLRDALRSQTVRDDITDGLRRMVHQASQQQKAQDDQKMQRFVLDFLKADEFDFK